MAEKTQKHQPCTILPCEGLTPMAAAQEAGRAGAAAGTAWVCGDGGDGGDWSAALLCRPQVPMGFLEAAAACGALAVAQEAGEDAQVRWPTAVAVEGREVARATASAGYGEGGVFLVLGLEGRGAAQGEGSGASSGSEAQPSQQGAAAGEDVDDAPAGAGRGRLGLEPVPAVEAAAAALADWEAALVAGGAAAGPWGPFLSDYFDALELLGQPVVALSPQGLPVAWGRLAGIDGWGRVTLQSPEGQERELAPGTARLVPDPEATQPAAAEGREG